MDHAQARAFLRRVRPGMCQDATRSHMAGTLLRVGGWASEEHAGDDPDGARHLVRTEVTDGHRAHVVDHEVHAVESWGTVMLPLGLVEMLALLVRLMSESERVRVALDPGNHLARLLVGSGTVSATYPLGDAATWPPLVRVLPPPADRRRTSLTVPARRLRQALKRAAVRDDGGVELHVGPSVGSLWVGTASDSVPVDVAAVGAEVKIGVSAAYLDDVLGLAGRADVELTFDGSLDPVGFRCDGAHGCIMPMRA